MKLCIGRAEDITIYNELYFEVLKYNWKHDTEENIFLNTKDYKFKLFIWYKSV